MNHVSKLIESMTKAERNAFSSVNSHYSETGYFKLYKYLCKYPNQKMEVIKAEFSQFSQIHVEMNRLYEKLLLSLTMRSLKSSNLESKLEKNIWSAYILIQKGLSTQAIKFLTRAKKIAISLEDFSSLITLVGLEEKVRFSSLDFELSVKLKTSTEERKRYTEAISEINQLRYLKIKIIGLVYTRGSYIPKAHIPEEILNAEVLKNKEAVQSIKAHDLKLFCNAQLLHYYGEYEASFELAHKRVELTKKYPVILSELEHFKSLNNCLYTSVIARNKEMYLKYIKLLRLAECRNKENDAVRSFFLLYYPIYFNQVTANMEELRTAITNALDFSSSSINSTQIQLFYIRLTTGYITLGEYKKANQQLALWQKTKSESYSELFTRLLSICVHLALENYDLLDRENKALNALLRNNQCKVQVYLELLHFSRALVKSPTNFQTLKAKSLENMRRSRAEDPLKLDLLEFDFIRWLEDLNL